MKMDVIKGQKVELTRVNDDLKKIVVFIEWNQRSPIEPEVLAIMLGVSGRVEMKKDLVFFQNVNDDSSSVFYYGRRGHAGQYIVIDLPLIPSRVMKIAFALVLANEEKRRAYFSKETGLHLQIANEANGAELVSFRPTEFCVDKAVVMAEIYRHQKEWKFCALGRSIKGGASSLYSSYGIQLNTEVIAEKPLSLPKKSKSDFSIINHLSGIDAVQEGCYLKKVRLAHLSNTSFQHPQDRAALEALGKIPGIDQLISKVNKHGLDQLYRGQFTGSNIRVTAKNFPQLHNALLAVCETLNMDKVPDLYVEQGFTNAVTVGVENSIIVIKASCLSLLSYDEILFILGHQCGHIKSENMQYHQIAQIFPLVSRLLVDTVDSGLQVALLNWYRKSEFTADRAGLLACQNMDAAVTAMMKIAGAPMKYYKTLDPQDFIQQAREFEGLDDDKMNTMAQYWSNMLLDQSWTVMRVSEMDKWVTLGDYPKIIEKYVRN